MSRTAVTITVSARVSAWYPSARDAAKPLLTKAGCAAGAQTCSSYQGPGRESRYLPKISHGMASSKTGAPSVTARPTVCGLMSVIYRKWSILPLCWPGPARQPRCHGAHQKRRCGGDVDPEPARTLPARAGGHGAGPARWLGGPAARMTGWGSNQFTPMLLRRARHPAGRIGGRGRVRDVRDRPSAGAFGGLSDRIALAAHGGKGTSDDLGDWRYRQHRRRTGAAAHGRGAAGAGAGP